MSESEKEVNEIAEALLKGCESLSGVSLYPYQKEFGLGIINACLETDDMARELSALFSRQGGKSYTTSAIGFGLCVFIPIFANLFYPKAECLEKYKGKPFLLGIYAPTSSQAQIIFKQMKNFLNLVPTKEKLKGFKVSNTVSNGERITLINELTGITSEVWCKSASEGSQVEGATANLMIVDEAQDVSDYKYLKSLSPIVSSCNGVRVCLGTTNDNDGFFHTLCERNKKATGEKAHFEFDYKIVSLYNRKYGAFVESEKKTLGEGSLEFQRSYSLKWIFNGGGSALKTSFWEKCGDTSRDLVMSSSSPVFVSIDFAKTTDTTYIHVGELEKNTTANLEKYPKIKLIGMKAIEPRDGLETPYIEQISQIKSYLSGFTDIRGVGYDSTGVGMVVGELLAKEIPNISLYPYILTQKALDEIWREFKVFIQNDLIEFPASPEAKTKRDWEIFWADGHNTRMFEKNGFLKISVQDNSNCKYILGRKVHDDAISSLGILTALARKNPEVVASKESLWKTAKLPNFRNRITARRRGGM